MALPFLPAARKKRDQAFAIDVGARKTKAVMIQRRGDRFALAGYAIVDAPIAEKSLPEDTLAEHLRAVADLMPSKGRGPAIFTLGVEDALVRHVEMPLMPPDDIRLILKNNSRTYLQQDLPNYMFDCYFSPESVNAASLKEQQAKVKVLIAGAKNQIIQTYLGAAKKAGLIADEIVPGIIGPINAFELSNPQILAEQTVALVEIGFRSSSISLLQQGELILNRVVSIGGDRLTAGLAEAMNVGYAEAEGIKLGMPTEVQAQLETLTMPLGRELRASIDFFEHQQEKTVSQVYVSGASAQSELILQILQTELMVECKAWNPAGPLELMLPTPAAEFEQVAPQLSVAIGAALAAI
jgi:type IV pilus assembly protein PilM